MWWNLAETVGVELIPFFGEYLVQNVNPTPQKTLLCTNRLVAEIQLLRFGSTQISNGFPGCNKPNNWAYFAHHVSYS